MTHSEQGEGSEVSTRIGKDTLYANLTPSSCTAIAWLSFVLEVLALLGPASKWIH